MLVRTADSISLPSNLKIEQVVGRVVRTLRMILTSVFFAPAMLAFILHGLLVVFFVRDQERRRSILVKQVGAYSRVGLWLLRVRVESPTFNVERFKSENFLVVCNHLSYLDMLILASVYPSVFVTSVDMGEVPFLGMLAELGGSLFIERRHRDRLPYDIQQIKERLEKGANVTLFPEGTSTDGREVRPFKRSLFQAAVDAGVRVQPLTLQYVEVDGRSFNERNRNRVCWYGSMSFAPHLVGLLAGRSVTARVTFLEPIAFTQEIDKHAMSEISHAVIAKKYGAPLGRAVD